MREGNSPAFYGDAVMDVLISFMSEIQKDESENLDQNDLSDEALTDVSGGTDPAGFDWSGGDPLRSSMTGRRPPKTNPF